MIHIKVDNKKFLYRMVIFVLFSNLLVYFISVDNHPAEQIIPLEGYQSVIAKLNLYTPFKKMTKVQLWDPKSKMLLKQVYLYKKIKSSELWKGPEAEFVIKIHHTEIASFLSGKNNSFDTYPARTKINFLKEKNRRIYEMAF